MTLLIGTISNKHLIITADGLSHVNPKTGAGVSSDTFPKVFPVPGAQIAFAHHGLNILEGKPVDEFIGGYIGAHGTVIATARLKDIAEDLRLYAEQAAQKAVAHPTNTGGVGFWIAGFGAGKGKPELYEIFWPDKPVPNEHKGIVFGGNGKEFIEYYLDNPLGSFHPNQVSQYSVDFVLLYHQALYKKAESKQNKDNKSVFGGRQQQLILERTGWKWTMPPS